MMITGLLVIIHSIQWIDNTLLIEKLKRDYCLIGVTRRDKIKSMLSLPLWVRFIDSILFENQLLD